MKDDVEIASSSELTFSIGTKNSEALKLCDGLIANYKRRSRDYRRFFRIFKYSSALLAISVIVLSSLSATQRIDQWIVPVVSGVSAFFAVLVSTSSAQELWILSRGIQRQFTAEKFLYLQSAGSYSKLDEEAKVRRF